MTINELLALWSEAERKPDIGKYTAVYPEAIAAAVARLDDTDREAADILRWLTWWYQFQSSGLRWREKEIGRLMVEGIAGDSTAEATK
jgi:hypothetical protein